MSAISAVRKARPMFLGVLQHQLFTFFMCVLVGAGIWFSPIPTGVTPQAWHLFAIFVFTILGLIFKPFPMGAVALMGCGITALTQTLSIDQALSGFTNNIVWLIVIAFFIARGFIKTGFGMRVAYFMMGTFGKSTLGMAYAMAFTDILLAPTIPSVTARAGGVIYPVVTALSKAFGSDPVTSPRKLGAFLVQTVFQVGAVTSAMFLTAMAGNPMIAQLAESNGIEITWGGWALAAFLPGVVSIILIPYILYKIYPPEMKKTPEAKEIAKEKLQELGPISKNEWFMIGTFCLLITLWIFGKSLGVNATVTAMIGISVLIISKVLSWNDVLEEKGAWDTLVWFSVLIMMASFLGKLGLTGWFSDLIMGRVQGMPWLMGFSILALIYFYTHYFFASNLAHISAMYAPFLILSIALGTPPALAALLLAFFSSLFGTLTQYGSGPAPILFGSGFVPIGKWWQMGFVISIINIVIWTLVGALWWKLLGLY